MMRGDRSPVRTGRDRDREDDERRQLESATYLSREKQHARMVLERLQERERLQEQDREKRNAQSADRCDLAPASTILGASTVRQLMGGGDSDPLQDIVKKNGEGSVYKAIAQALVTYRYTGKNAADPKKLVMKDDRINEYRGKLNFADGNRAGIEPVPFQAAHTPWDPTFAPC